MAAAAPRADTGARHWHAGAVSDRGEAVRQFVVPLALVGAVLAVVAAVIAGRVARLALRVTLLGAAVLLAGVGALVAYTLFSSR